MCCSNSAPVASPLAMCSLWSVHVPSVGLLYIFLGAFSQWSFILTSVPSPQLGLDSAEAVPPLRPLRSLLNNSFSFHRFLLLFLPHGACFCSVFAPSVFGSPIFCHLLSSRLWQPFGILHCLRSFPDAWASPILFGLLSGSLLFSRSPWWSRSLFFSVLCEL